MPTQLPRAPAPRLFRKSQMAPDEVLVLETRATRFRYFPGPIAALVVMGILTYAAAGALWSFLPAFPGLTWAFLHLQGVWVLPMAVFAVMVFFLALSALWLLVNWLLWNSRVYVITDHRVMVQRGIFSRAVDEIPVNQVRGVDVYQSFWHRLLRYGTIHISSEAGAGVGNEDWYGIPKPFEFQRLIETAMENLALPHPFAVPGGRFPTSVAPPAPSR